MLDRRDLHWSWSGSGARIIPNGPATGPSHPGAGGRLPKTSSFLKKPVATPS